jgi:hypothetical protein
VLTSHITVWYWRRNRRSVQKELIRSRQIFHPEHGVFFTMYERLYNIIYMSHYICLGYGACADSRSEIVTYDGIGFRAPQQYHSHSRAILRSWRIHWHWHVSLVYNGRHTGCRTEGRLTQVLIVYWEWPAGGSNLRTSASEENILLLGQGENTYDAFSTIISTLFELQLQMRECALRSFGAHFFYVRSIECHTFIASLLLTSNQQIIAYTDSDTN